MTEAQRPVQFDFGQLISDSWRIFSSNAGPLLGGVVITAIIVAVGNGMAMVVGSLLMGPLTLGLFKMARDASRGGKADFVDLFFGFREKFIHAFVANLLISIFTAVGFILCIVPGILVSILYMLTYLFLLETNLDFWGAMEASRKKVMEDFGQWLLLGLLLMALNLVGSIPCGLGLLVTAPMTLVALTLAYDQAVLGAAPPATAADVPPPPPTDQV